MVAVTARVAAGTRYSSSIYKIRRVSTFFHKRTKRRGGEPGSSPLPYELRTSEIRTGKTARPMFLWSLLEFFEEEALVDLAGIAGLAQVVLFEGARAAGGVSAPASNRLQIITT